MNKEFVNYEIALALKELGFDEPCLAYYDESLYFPENDNIYGTFCNQPIDTSYCSAPLYQQAFRWFREKYGYYYPIHRITNNTNQVLYSIGSYAGDYFTYEEAENACIDKLIEIAKQQTK
jgi:hypothetical protein